MSLSGGPQSLTENLSAHVTCLGCGCACDDIEIQVVAGRIAAAGNACPLGVQWFGDGQVPDRIRHDGRDVTLESATDALAALLTRAGAPLVYLAPELACEAQRQAVAVADRLRATLDTVTSATALSSILAAQERGRAAATLSEIRNRADLVVFWGVDPHVRYPRYWSRYAPEPAGLHIGGRRDRMVIAVDVGPWHGPADADVRLAVDPADEVALLTAVAAIVRTPGITFPQPLGGRAESLATPLAAAHYVVVVADAEAEPAGEPHPGSGRDRQRAAALVALTQALNGPTRCALSTLRGGGNRTGADAVLTAQTGYPTAVSFAAGVPAYRPFDAAAAADAVLVLGDAGQLPPGLLSQFAQVPLAIVGPRASRHVDARIAIDTGVAGIHTSGMVLRLDDVPLPLRPPLGGPLDPGDVLAALLHRLGARGAAADRGNARPRGGLPAPEAAR